VLTAAGEAVLGNVERIENEALAVARQIAGKDIRLEGNIRLTTVETLAAFVLAPAFAEFRRTHPLVELEIAANNRQVSLLKREADVALRVGAFQQADIVARKVGNVAYAVYASAEYLDRHGTPDWAAGGAGHEVILTEHDLLDTVAMVWFRNLMPKARVALASNSRLIQLEATRSGVGLACLSCYLVYEQPDLIRLNAPEAPKSDLWLGVHADLRHTPRIRAFTDALGHALHGAARRLDP
jgi:DNA-binding transcriptional LysR family regulator